jgi:hypothetical protein
MSFEESGILSENQTMQCFEDRPSHQISAFPLDPDIFDFVELKTYEKPVDSTPVLSSKEVQSLRQKFEDFKSNKKVPQEKSPRPIIKSPLSKRPQNSSPINQPSKVQTIPKTRNSSNSSLSQVKTFNISPLVQIKSQPSYKKPLITLKVFILGKEIHENIFDGDYSLDVAKKVFAAVPASPSYKELKALAFQIEESIQSYMNEVSAEILKFQKNSKKVEESLSKKRLEKIKPPLLMTEKRADQKRTVLGKVSVKLDGKEIEFQVKEADNPLKIAEKICEKNQVSKDFMSEIVKEIRDVLDKANKKFLFRLEFEVNGKIAELALYDGDDVLYVAQKFCRENRLGSEYISKIEEVLKKQLNNVI